jgi:hypothetical protein
VKLSSERAIDVPTEVRRKGMYLKLALAFGQSLSG